MEAPGQRLFLADKLQTDTNTASAWDRTHFKHCGAEARAPDWSFISYTFLL